MIDQTVRDEIKAAYRQVHETLQLTPRRGQWRMIAEIYRGFMAGEDERPPMCVIEAGTGTGKTLAYLLAVMPIARALDAKVVIATATVALQEQIIRKDIPELIANTDLDFSYCLAKGRGRYLCLSRLQALLAGKGSQEAFDLGGAAAAAPAATSPQFSALCRDMHGALEKGQWDGDRDSWQWPLPNWSWSPLTIDRARCMGANCRNYDQCYFYSARNRMWNADCIVCNQDLLLADLALGGGAILPEPEETLYVIDEAHHLPVKGNSHFAVFTDVRAALQTVVKCDELGASLVKADVIDTADQKELHDQRTAAQRELGLLLQYVEGALLPAAASRPERDGSRRLVFELGVVPDELRRLAKNLDTSLGAMEKLLKRFGDTLKERAARGETDGALAESWFPVVGTAQANVATSRSLFAAYAEGDEPSQAPMARWLTFGGSEDGGGAGRQEPGAAAGERPPARRRGAADARVVMSASPVLSASHLQDNLWSRCVGAVLTSATLSALGRFDSLARRAGLPEHSRYRRIASPFPFATAATFAVPRLGCDPRSPDRHTQAIGAAIPRLVAADEAALALFSSRKQMHEVMARLPRPYRERLLCQDSYQKGQLLKRHRSRVDAGQGSIIFGLASFAEGVDLPGKYCTHVLIARIPFAMPEDPVELTFSQWIERQGENPFMTLSVPDAAVRLVQACGRLLRHETDTGKITLFDERIVTKPYGREILDSLPPYRRELLEVDLRGLGRS